MQIKNQLNKLKDNWLLILILLIIVFGSNLNFSQINAFESISVSKSFSAEERIVTSSINLKVEVNNYQEKEIELKNLIQENNAILSNQNINKKDKLGSFSIKVPSKNYDVFISAAKDLGKVISFNENKRDITDQYLNNKQELNLEKSRLAKFEKMLKDATEVKDKVQLTDRIFDLERRIKYLEENSERNDKLVDYITIWVNIYEKRYDFVTFSNLIDNLVNNFNLLFKFLFGIIPWLIAFFIGKWIYRKF